MQKGKERRKRTFLADNFNKQPLSPSLSQTQYCRSTSEKFHVYSERSLYWPTGRSKKKIYLDWFLFSHKTFAIRGKSENNKSKLLFPFWWKLKVKSESEDGKIAFSQWSVLPLGLTYWVWRIGNHSPKPFNLKIYKKKSSNNNKSFSSQKQKQFLPSGNPLWRCKKVFVKSFGSLCENIKKTLMIQHLFFKCAQSIYQTNGQVVCIFLSF